MVEDSFARDIILDTSVLVREALVLSRMGVCLVHECSGKA
jgi:hypothetical protein